MRRFTYSFLLLKCSQSFLTLAPYINTGHIHTHKNGSSMLTDWAGLTRSPSLAMGGNNPSPAQTHTHTLRQTLSSPLLLTDLQQCSHASPASPETLDCQQKTHTYTPNVLSVLAHTHTHTLENFLPAYTTHKSQAQTCTHRDKCTPENTYFTTKTLNDTLTSSRVRKTRAHMTVVLNTTP